MKSTKVIMVEQEKRNVVPWILKSIQHALETCHGPQSTKCVIGKVLIRNTRLATETFSSPSFWCVTMALPFTWKNILRKNKNYGNSNISPCKKKCSKKNPLKETKFFQDIITLSLIPSFNISQNIIFQKSSHKNKPTTWGPKSIKLLYSIMI
jgi:hypothetical protein